MKDKYTYYCCYDPDNERAFEKYADAIKAMSRRGRFRSEKL